MTQKNLLSELCTSRRRLLVKLKSTKLPFFKQVDLPGFDKTRLYYRSVPSSREDLNWQINDTLDIGFALEANRNALAISALEIMNNHRRRPYRNLQIFTLL